MTIDYNRPTMAQYKDLIREEGRLYMEIRLAAVSGDFREERKLKQERKLVWNRLVIMQAAFAIKHKKMATA